MIPQVGQDGIPIHDEIDLCRMLDESDNVVTLRPPDGPQPNQTDPKEDKICRYCLVSLGTILHEIEESDKRVADAARHN